MALINCPECGKEVSSSADKCINCGFPINRRSSSSKKEQVITIQKTSKDIKAQSATGCALYIIALACLFIGIAIYDRGGSALMVVGVVLILMGFVFKISARTKKWWNHD